MRLACLAIAALLAGAPAFAEEGRPIGPPFRVETTRDLGGGLLAYEVWKGDFPVCGRGPDGAPLAGFVLDGTWDARMGWHPGGVTLACPGGAAAKCVLAGYRPWEGAAARGLHLSCVRMIRADYCGDGTAHTVPGVRIGVTDGAEPMPEDVESGWRPDGATRIARTRFPEGMDHVRRHCPGRLDPEGPAPFLWNE